MTLLEYLDRRAERQAQNPRPPRDIRQFIGAMFLVGYYVMVWQFSHSALPQENIDLVRDAMLTLGPPIGIIIGAMFRTDAKDEQATRNTGEAFKAIEATAKVASPAIQDVHVTNPPSEPVPTTTEERP